jgi:hypothetical protein
MKYRLPSIAVGLLVVVFSIYTLAATKEVTVTGWVSDENCGAQHTKPGGKDCVLKCMKGGAHIGHPEWKPQRMVFVTDEEQKIWIVENPDALKGYEGDHVKITGKVNTKKKSVKVTSVGAV